MGGKEKVQVGDFGDVGEVRERNLEFNFKRKGVSRNEIFVISVVSGVFSGLWGGGGDWGY